MNKPSSDSFIKFVIVASSCVISFITFGVARLAGQLFVACRERFNTGRKEASLPFVLCYTLRNISGPIVGYLGNAFGLRFITATGCLLAAISVGACFLVEDIITFTVLWGGCYGFAFGMGSILIINILHLHFDKSFNKMHGFFQAGGCMGTLVLPAVCEFLLQNYGFSGTLLITSGIILNCLPAAMLLKNPTKKKHGAVKNISTEEAEIATIDYAKSHEPQSCTLPTIPDNVNRNLGDDCKTTSSNHVVFDKATIALSSEDDKPERSQENKESHVEVPKKKKSIDTNKCNPNSMTKLHSFCSQNFNVFLDPTYILLVISLAITTVIVTTLFTIIVDVCRDKGIVEDVAVLMTYAVTDTLGRMLVSYVADVGCISPVNLYVLCCVGIGLALLGLTCLKSFYIVLLDITAIGLFSGGTIVIPVAILKNFMEKDSINMAFSSRYTVFAIMSFGQSPVIGYFRETLRSYDGLFYLMGCMCLVAAITTSLIPSAAKYRDKRKNKEPCANLEKKTEIGC